jgi:hypothetical protein
MYERVGVQLPSCLNLGIRQEGDRVGPQWVWMTGQREQKFAYARNPTQSLWSSCP